MHYTQRPWDLLLKCVNFTDDEIKEASQQLNAQEHQALAESAYMPQTAHHKKNKILAAKLMLATVIRQKNGKLTEKERDEQWRFISSQK